MKLFKTCLIFMMLLVLLLSIGNVFSADINDLNSTIDDVDSNDELLKINSDDSLKENFNEDNSIFQESDEIQVETWEDIQYYSSLNDKNYVLKLKENTNYYPSQVESTDSQIIFNNNVTIIGAEGAYFGDSSPNPRNITYTAMKVAENSGNGITFKGITFKWIGTRYQPDGVFCEMAGNAINYIEDCFFTNISTNLGHSSILHIKLGDAIVSNCTFVNCTTDFGCLSVYNPKDDPTETCVLARMNVSDSYFEGNYARTEPGCINNCGILVVRNSTFHHNSAFWWAGAIHTHGGANTTLYDCIFTDNVAGWNGGALYTYSYLQIYNTTFIGNNCTTNNGGGAIGACKYLHAPYIIIKDSLFKDNANNCWGVDELSDGTGRGGAISLMDQGLLDVRNTTFIKNSASMGTAICAINGGLQMGSPDVIIVGNRFINHTRVGDVLDVRLATYSYLEIDDNYYLNNSFEFKKLRLVSDEKIGDDVVVHIDAELKNPNSFENDILETTPYDIYVDGVYNQTVIGTIFTLKLRDGETCHVYAVPCISNSVTNEILVGVPKEYIYVSQSSGIDTNNGLTRSTPVKTISKAIDLARTKGNIVIMDGTYNEGNLTVDYNLTIAGENNVKFSGNYELGIKNIFTVTDADLSLSGITFDNIVMIGDTKNKDKRIIQHTNGYLKVDNCTFNKISTSGLTGMVLIETNNIEIYNSKFTENSKSGVYVTLIKSNEFLVDNCIFTNNIASHSSYASLITTAASKKGVKGTITDSIFENNKVKYGCVYFSASDKPLTITNTRFIANTVGSTSDHSSCIKIEESPILRVDQSIFKDNVNFGTRAAVIYASGGSGSVFVSNSIIVNNSFTNNNNVVFSASTANNLKVYKNLNANWWGNTLENYTIAPKVYASACNSWIVLNMTANTTNLAYNQKALVSIDFYNAFDREGNFSFVDASKLPSFDLNVVANNGMASASKISVVNGMATVEYTLKSYDSGSLTVSYSDVESTVDFVWSLVDPEIEINVENNTYGNPTDISISVPSDVDTSKFSLKINNNAYSFNNVITIPKLDAGEYLINLTYSGDAKYNPYTLTKLFKIEKATPQLTVDVEDVYYPNSAIVTVNTGDATGEISINVGDRAYSKSISSGKAEFILANLQANDYTIDVTYSGDRNYLASNASANFKVKKYNSTITISNSNIAVGSDVILTFTVKSDASGTVTVDINGEKANVTISQGSATYTIRSISRGLYNIVATYNGDAKYLSSQNTTQLDVARLDPTLNVAVSSVTYGQDAVFTINLNNDASGTVTVIVDGKNNTAQVTNGMATLSLSDLTAGNNKNALIQYSGDNKYKPKETSKTFNIAKAKPTITIDAVDIKEGQVSNVQITITKGTTGTIQLVTPSGTENPTIPRTGRFTRTFEDLAVNQYTISANYGGDSNYLSASVSKTFSVTVWDVPQWPNEGYDVKNTEKSPYDSDANGNIAWVKDIEGTIIGNMAIDSAGNIYITTSNGIYSIKATDGSNNWIFNSQDAGNNFSGIAISRDVILAPKSMDKLYFINQTTGEKYNNNIYQGSSLFAPLVDNEGNIYISGEYYGDIDPTKLVIVPYKIWQTSTEPTSINLGDVDITSSPILVDKNTVFLTTTVDVKGIDLLSKTIKFAKPIVSDSNPVVGIGNITYIISNGHVISFDVQGTTFADVEISGTPGNHLSVGVNGEIFSINREGKLFDYSTGSEILIYDFKEPISSRLLVGQDDKLYVGSDSGIFYAIDVEGNSLWKVNLNQSISNSPVMDNNGVIYVVSGNRIVAINQAALKDSQLSGVIENVNYKEDVKVDINIASQATGVVSIKIGSVYTNQSDIGNGNISFTIPNLNVGNYVAKITYAGDERFESKVINIPFKVLKLNPTIDVQDSNIQVGESLTVNVNFLENDVTGNVQITVDGLSNSSAISNGQATLKISGLAKGEYSYTVTYSGDANYNSYSTSNNISVGYVPTSFSVSSHNINVGQDCEITVTNFPSDANGVVYVNYNNENYYDLVKNSNAKIIIPNLGSGTYNFEVRYANDTKYSADSQRVSVSVSKITPTPTITINNIDVGDDIVVAVTGLATDATGLITATIEGISRNASVANGKANIIIPQRLPNGSYNVQVSYLGDDKYNSVSQSKSIKISKVTPAIAVEVNNIYVGDDLIVDISGLPNDASGTITASIGDISNTSTVENGAASVTIEQNLANGTYIINVVYSGDDKFNSVDVPINVIISKKSVGMIVTANQTISVGDDLKITVLNLPNDGSRYLLIRGDIENQVEIKNNKSEIIIPNLSAGRYSYYIYYPSSSKYESKQVNMTVNVNKIPVTMRITYAEVTYGQPINMIVSGLPADASGTITVTLDGYEFSAEVINGGAVVNVDNNLDPGNYSAIVTYSGDLRFDQAVITFNLEVPKINLDLSDYISVSKTDEGSLVEVSLPSDVTGEINVKVNGKNYNGNLINGFTSIIITDLNPGIYTAAVSYNGNSKYESANANVIINAKTDTVVSLVYDKDAKELVATLTTADGGALSGTNVNFVVGGVSYAVKTSSKGVAKLSVADLNPGIYSAIASYNGNARFNPSNASAVVNTKIDTVVSLVYDKDAKELVATLTTSDGGALSGTNVNINVGGSNYAVKTNSRGIAKLSIADLGTGIFTASASYNGNARFNPSNASAVVNTKTDTVVSLVYDDNTKELTATLSTVAGTGLSSTNVVVNVGGVDHTLKTNSRGIAKLSTDDLSPGSYVASATYNGNSRFNPSNASINMKVTMDTVVSLVYNDDTKELTATLTTVKGLGLSSTPVFVNIGGVNYSLRTNSRGVAILSVDDLNPGSYVASASYNGNSRFNPSNASINMKVTMNTVISLVFDADANELVATLTTVKGLGLSSTPVYMNVGGVDYTVKTNSRGIAKLSTDDLSPGSYVVTANYNGNSRFNPSNASIIMKATMDTVISLVYDSSVKELVATLTTVEGTALSSTTININVAGSDYAVKTNNRGVAKLSTADLKLGVYNAIASYNGNSKFESSNATAVVNTKIGTAITLVYDESAKELVATLNIVDGGALSSTTVNINVDGVDYAVKTNSRGVAKLSVSDLTPGNHVATASYNGNYKFDAAESSINMRVKTETVLSAVYDADAKELTVTLTTAEGGALSSTTVNINIDGVDYAVKTNNKGVAKLSAADIAPGSYTASISYAGNYRFGSGSTTIDIEV